jgi:F-type H+-transporting ATPase subunit b
MQRAKGAVFHLNQRQSFYKIYNMQLLTPDLGLFFWNLLAFVIVFFILKKFAWKPILASLKQREVGIADSLAQAEKVRAEMAQLKSENEALLVQAREERAIMLKEARETKDKIINEAREKAQLEAARILTDTQAVIEQQKMAAIIDVKNHVGNMVVEVSEKILRRELSNKQDQENYIRQLVTEVKKR